ncbi:MAG: flagellar biosynthesis protein FliQ [Anaeromicrobium sp.]|jgi:flagellar biosynthetic protein FliQ|uniref:flagellar biosynthesis protein FliQ n=1 Tax=Anaeromicrobium sp. TaxID=1929132 RepID=UPI0025E27C1D|nr:flagellar biosynthesis protein FliQ [Anaeromicrobium sp.]MCT4595595.1 flagellar biosynthesis protein FliQ [Anaeromicrobium sp.]
MSQGLIVELLQQSMTKVILLAAPMLMLSLFMGLAISIFQATTQIQEQTLTFVPKILSVLIAIMVFGPWILNTIVDYTQGLFLNIDKYIQ